MIRNITTLALGVLSTALVLFPGCPTQAADGQVLITHAKAVAGNVTAGDPAGYPATLSKSGSYILGGDLTPGPNLDAIVGPPTFPSTSTASRSLADRLAERTMRATGYGERATG